MVYEKGKPVAYGDVKGDTFTFDVYRCSGGKLSFQAEKPANFSDPLVQNLPNREHTLEIITVGDGEVTLDALYVFQPPEKD